MSGFTFFCLLVGFCIIGSLAAIGLVRGAN
jgi:hypothetical protein